MENIKLNSDNSSHCSKPSSSDHLPQSCSKTTKDVSDAWRNAYSVIHLGDDHSKASGVLAPPADYEVNRPDLISQTGKQGNAGLNEQRAYSHSSFTTGNVYNETRPSSFEWNFLNEKYMTNSGSSLSYNEASNKHENMYRNYALCNDPSRVSVPSNTNQQRSYNSKSSCETMHQTHILNQSQQYGPYSSIVTAQTPLGADRNACNSWNRFSHTSHVGPSERYSSNSNRTINSQAEFLNSNYYRPNWQYDTRLENMNLDGFRNGSRNPYQPPDMNGRIYDIGHRPPPVENRTELRFNTRHNALMSGGTHIQHFNEELGDEHRHTVPQTTVEEDTQNQAIVSLPNGQPLFKIALNNKQSTRKRAKPRVRNSPTLVSSIMSSPKCAKSTPKYRRGGSHLKLSQAAPNTNPCISAATKRTNNASPEVVTLMDHDDNARISIHDKLENLATNANMKTVNEPTNHGSTSYQSINASFTSAANSPNRGSDMETSSGEQVIASNSGASTQDEDEIPDSNQSWNKGSTKRHMSPVNTNIPTENGISHLPTTSASGTVSRNGKDRDIRDKRSKQMIEYVDIFGDGNASREFTNPGPSVEFIDLTESTNNKEARNFMGKAIPMKCSQIALKSASAPSSKTLDKPCERNDKTQETANFQSGIQISGDLQQQARSQNTPQQSEYSDGEIVSAPQSPDLIGNTCQPFWNMPDIFHGHELPKNGLGQPEGGSESESERHDTREDYFSSMTEHRQSKYGVRYAYNKLTNQADRIENSSTVTYPYNSDSEGRIDCEQMPSFLPLLQTPISAGNQGHEYGEVLRPNSLGSYISDSEVSFRNQMPLTPPQTLLPAHLRSTGRNYTPPECDWTVPVHLPNCGPGPYAHLKTYFVYQLPPNVEKHDPSCIPIGSTSLATDICTKNGSMEPFPTGNANTLQYDCFPNPENHYPYCVPVGSPSLITEKGRTEPLPTSNTLPYDGFWKIDENGIRKLKRMSRNFNRFQRGFPYTSASTSKTKEIEADKKFEPKQLPLKHQTIGKKYLHLQRMCKKSLNSVPNQNVPLKLKLNRSLSEVVALGPKAKLQPRSSRPPLKNSREIVGIPQRP